MQEMRLTPERTLQHYIQRLMGEYVASTLPLVAVRRLEFPEQEFGEGSDTPPPVPFESVFLRPTKVIPTRYRAPILWGYTHGLHV